MWFGTIALMVGYIKRCRICEVISEVLGKRLFERYFFKNKKLVKQEVVPLTRGLNVQIVGGGD